MSPRIHLLAACGAIAFLLAAAPRFVRAQGAGPMAPAESTKFPTPPPPAKPEPPTLPPDEIIRRFAAKEDEMARAIRGYTFQKDVRIQEVGQSNRAAGQLDVVTQMTVTPDGRLTEKPVSRQPSTLHYLDLERGDGELVAPAPMFPLTTAVLPKYEITYGGKQPLDELSTYYFNVKPRALERAHAYFSGVIWVDTTDLVIVRTMGKWVTETGDVTAADLPFTVFETYRQQIGKLWFPAYARSDDAIPSDAGDISIRVIVKWTDFKPQDSTPAAASPAPSPTKSPDSKGTP
jgi:hypothetical protein